MQSEAHAFQGGLSPRISRMSAWAFAIGTSVGWGSLIVTANTYLAQAGPMGSCLGLILGGLVMLVISRAYAYLMSCYPDAGGPYVWCREAFGYDHGFLASWFMTLTYAAMLWANGTALPLFARYFLGDIFRFGRMYTLFGYEVYAGEAMLSAAFLLGTAWFCARFAKGPVKAMTGMALFFSAGIIVCFAASFFRPGVSAAPIFLPDRGSVGQVLKIAIISPWAYIGFESVCHGAEELTFHHEKMFRVLVTAVVSTMVLYILVTLLSVSAYPPEYSSWLAYIQDLDNLEGIKGLPAFYAAERYMGSFGTGILMLSLLCLVLTSLIGNVTVLSRLFFALGRDGILPSSFAKTGRHGTPDRATMLIAGISVLIPLLGRTAIGWIVDVTTLGATLIYGLVCAAARKIAAFRGDKKEAAFGTAGTVIMVAFACYLLIPNLFAEGDMAPESYFLFVAWSVLGFLFFRTILKRDRQRRFGKTIVVWIALLSLILFISLVWMNQSILEVTHQALTALEHHFEGDGLDVGDAAFISGQMDAIRWVSARSIFVVVLLFGLSLGVLINNYRLKSNQADVSERELFLVRERAGRDALTGVKNKLAYTEREHEMDRMIQEKQAAPFSLAVLDVNGLKHVNDTLGHQEGDRLIQEACRIICRRFAHSPVFRTGGDEFVVLIQGSDYENRKELVSAFRAQSEAHITTGEPVVSIGCTDYRPDEDRQLGDLFIRADKEMYENKMQLKKQGAITRT